MLTEKLRRARVGGSVSHHRPIDQVSLDLSLGKKHLQDLMANSFFTQIGLVNAGIAKKEISGIRSH